MMACNIILSLFCRNKLLSTFPPPVSACGTRSLFIFFPSVSDGTTHANAQLWRLANIISYPLLLLPQEMKECLSMAPFLFLLDKRMCSGFSCRTMKTRYHFFPGEKKHGEKWSKGYKRWSGPEIWIQSLNNGCPEQLRIKPPCYSM
jgi:hypothetical protein